MKKFRAEFRFGTTDMNVPIIADDIDAAGEAIEEKYGEIDGVIIHFEGDVAAVILQGKS